MKIDYTTQPGIVIDTNCANVRVAHFDITGGEAAKCLIEYLMTRSQWAMVEPYPDCVYRVTVKTENLMLAANWLNLPFEPSPHPTVHLWLSGGVLQGVRSDSKDVRVVLTDCDDLEAEGISIDYDSEAFIALPHIVAVEDVDRPVDTTPPRRPYWLYKRDTTSQWGDDVIVGMGGVLTSYVLDRSDVQVLRGIACYKCWLVHSEPIDIDYDATNDRDVDTNLAAGDNEDEQRIMLIPRGGVDVLPVIAKGAKQVGVMQLDATSLEEALNYVHEEWP